MTRPGFETLGTRALAVLEVTMAARALALHDIIHDEMALGAPGLMDTPTFEAPSAGSPEPARAPVEA